MDIVVHGTKGGRQIFTPKKLGGLLDVNSDASKASAIGQEAYAIRFVENTIIFSKYKIIRDVRGDKRTGFLAFSLFLPNNKKLHGIDIIFTLDKVSGEYCKRYIPENDNNLKDVREDWAFLDRISEEYKAKLRTISADDIENLLSGTKDDAFIYYENDEKLQKYFDKSYQDEYSQYRQVLFVKEELKDKPENPLNALRHSEDNLTGKIDLENPKYKLLYNQTAKGGVRIDVKVNKITRLSKSKIRRKDELEISWSKQYCETVTKRGKWNEISNEFIDVNSSAESVLVKEIIPPDKTKTLTFGIKDRKGNPVKDAEITCKSGNESKTITNNLVTFRGEEIGQRWTISAKKGDNLFSAIKNIIPENESRVELVLNERKKVKFQGEFKTENDSKYFPDIKISIREKNIDKSPNTEVEFIDDEINKPFKVIAIYSENNKYLSGEKEFYPKDTKDGRLVSIELKQQVSPPTSRIYLVDAGKHGTASAGYSYKEDGTDVTIKEKKGYIFTGFKLDKTKKKKNYEGTHVAQYKKKKPFYQNPKFIAASIVGAIIIGFGVWALFSLPGKDQPEQTQQPPVQQVQAYIEGNSLILDTLSSYKDTLGEEQPEVLDSLNIAIKKREFINNWNFDTLKKLHYYPKQQKFKTEIGKIDSTRYGEVKKRFHNVSTWSLDQIADSINAFLISPTPSITEKSPKEEKIEKDKKKEEPPKEVKQTPEQEQNKEERTDSPSVKPGNTKDISGALQSGTITREELQSRNTAGMDKYQKSIGLYLKFWSIVNSGQKDDFNKLLKDVKSDAILKNSELKNFLTSICTSSDAFQKYNIARGKEACKTIAELKNKVK